MASVRHSIDFHIWRGSRNPDPDDSFACLWNLRCKERLLESLDRHLDTLLLEFDSMFRSTVECPEDLRGGVYADKQDFAEFLAENRAPFQAPDPTRALVEEEFRALIPDTAADLTFARVAFYGWRDLDEEALLDLCLHNMPLLFEQHEHFRASFCVLYNRIQDTAGWGFWRIRDVAGFLDSRFWCMPAQ